MQAPHRRIQEHVTPKFLQPEAGREFYFAFGANMAPRVIDRRGLKPKAALPGSLHNYKLYFQHIGGVPQKHFPACFCVCSDSVLYDFLGQPHHVCTHTQLDER
jgi:hypothetical protein